MHMPSMLCRGFRPVTLAPSIGAVRGERTDIWASSLETTKWSAPRLCRASFSFLGDVLITVTSMPKPAQGAGRLRAFHAELHSPSASHRALTPHDRPQQASFLRSMPRHPPRPSQPYLSHKPQNDSW